MKKIIFACSILLLAYSFTLRAQDTSYARYDINNLTGSYMHGRGASYRGDSIAARFIRNELKHYGVQPLGENYYQRYTYNTHSMEGNLRISLDGSVLQPFVQYRVAPFSRSIHNSLGDNPLVRVPAETLIDTDALRSFLRKHEKSLASAVLYLDATTIQPVDDAQKEAYKHAFNDLKQRNPYGSAVLIVGVKALNTQGLSFADREHDYAYVEVLADAIPKRVRDVNIDISTQYRADYRTQNVCGIIPGKSDSIVIFGAHYDHLGTMGDDVYFPGAHDNASGVAAVLELARNFAQDTPTYTLVFMFFSGEEAGIKGSRYAAEHPLVDLSKVRLMVNIDMFCGGDEGLMVFNANDAKTAPFVQRLETLNDVLQVIPEIRRRNNSPNSDHYYFSQRCPALFFLSMGGRSGGYHDPSDTSARCGLDNFVNYLTLISSLAF